MKEYIPLLQTLVWPLFIGGLVWWGRSKFLQLLEAIRLRIEQGSSFEASASGLKIGEGRPRLEATFTTKPSDTKNPGFYVVHKASKARTFSSSTGEPHYRLSIYVECDPGLSLDQIDRVIYHLHPTFREPVRTVTDADSWFELVTKAWGQFNLEAEIYLKAAPDVPLKVERYLNF